MEDGYNLASLEAMATGMPLLCNAHPSCPIEDGVSGFVSDRAEDLREGANRLLADPGLAGAMGRAAREIAATRFAMRNFVEAWQRVIETAVAGR